MNDFAEILGLDKLKSNLDSKALQERKSAGLGCVLCNYSGFVNTPDGRCKMCSCNKTKMMHEIYEKSNVPHLYYGKTVQDWNTRTDSLGNDLGIQQIISERVYALLNYYDQSIFPICKGFEKKIKHSGTLKNKLHSLCFIGGVGSGKTFIASVMVQSALNKKLTAKYYDWTDLIDTIIDFNKKDELEEIIESFKNYDFIAIDGVEFFNTPQAHVPLQIDRLSKSRLNSGKPIFILGNNSMSQIQAGSGWQSLLNSCLTIRLPNAIK